MQTTKTMSDNMSLHHSRYRKINTRGLDSHVKEPPHLYNVYIQPKGAVTYDVSKILPHPLCSIERPP